jgi:hypothetical protein
MRHCLELLHLGERVDFEGELRNPAVKEYFLVVVILLQEIASGAPQCQTWGGCLLKPAFDPEQTLTRATRMSGDADQTCVH